MYEALKTGQIAYAATKAGMIGFSKSLAREIGSRSITVNVVAPGFIDTDMTRVLPEDQRAAMLSQVPLGRLGEGTDIAAAVVFLASNEAGYITGHALLAKAYAPHTKVAAGDARRCPRLTPGSGSSTPPP